MVGILTVHSHLRKHQHRMEIFDESTECRLSGEEVETASRIIYDCLTLTHTWKVPTRRSDTERRQITTWEPRQEAVEPNRGNRCEREQPAGHNAYQSTNMVL